MPETEIFDFLILKRVTYLTLFKDVYTDVNTRARYLKQRIKNLDNQSKATFFNEVNYIVYSV